MRSAITALTLTFLLVTMPLFAVTAYYQPTPYPASRANGIHIWDGWITNLYYDKKFIRDDKLQIGGWGDIYRMYIKFDLTGLPKNVSLAGLALMTYPRGDSSTPVKANMYLITGNWNPSTMTWDTQPSATGVAAFSAPTPGQWAGMNVTTWYNSWQSGSKPNYGFMFSPQANANNFNMYRSSRYGNDGIRPFLQLEFTQPVTTPSLKIPLPGNVYWLVTTEAGGYDCKGLYDQYHDGSNWFSIDFSWKHRNSSGNQVYSKPNEANTIPVLAAAAGRVVTVNATNRNNDNGYYVVLDHDSDSNVSTGFSTRYLHLNSPPDVQVGQTVSQGQRLGWMGNTGISQGDHLHFGIRYNNSGASTRSELTYVVMDGWLLKSFQTECGSSGDYIRYYRSSNSTF